MTSISCFEAQKNHSCFSSFGSSKSDVNAPKRVPLSEINKNVYSNQQYSNCETMNLPPKQPKFQGFQFKPSNQSSWFDQPNYSQPTVVDETDDWPDFF